MQFPIITATTAGIILILQMLLAFTVSGARGKHTIWVGTDGNKILERLSRRHANLAENAGIFIAAFTLLELSSRSPLPLIYLCCAFVIARLAHAIGLSQENTGNVFRLAGGMGTYLLGFLVGGLLLWVTLSLNI